MSSFRKRAEANDSEEPLEVRRIKNREVIERRRRKVRRKRIYRLALFLGAIAAIGGALARAGVALVESGHFSTKVVKIYGNHRAPADDLVTLAGGPTPGNLFLLDLHNIRDRVKSQGWVEDAAVSRVFPSTLEVRVRERAPVAIAAIGPRMWLVDDAGNRIAPYRASEGAFDLPFLTGIGEEDAQESLELGLRTLSAVVECDPGLAGRLSEISCRGESARVIFQDATPAIVIGSENLVERIRFYLEIRKNLGVHFSKVDYVDVRFAPKLFLRGAFRIDAPQTQGSAAPAAGTEGGLKHG